MRVHPTSSPIATTDLPEKWAKHMASLPESGMGYQSVRCLVEGINTPIRGIVLNGSKLETAVKIDASRITSIEIDKG